MEDIDDFVGAVQPGDIIVGGENWLRSSGHAPLAIRGRRVVRHR